MASEYSRAIAGLDEFSNFEKKAHILKPAFSLDGIKAILKRLGNPENSFKSIHVAGTVGKGSVCFMLDSALRASGLKSGLYISPHITDIRERIQAGGKMITRAEFAEMYRRVRADGAADPHEHTYFEAITAMAILYFAELGVDTAVVETGLGGRLDSTNAVPGFLSVITRIGLDHTAVLGGTLPEITAEKAGIIKRGAPLVALKQHPSVVAVFEKECHRKKSKLYLAEPAAADNIAALLGPRFASGFQRENLSIVATAISALRDLGIEINERKLPAAISRTQFSGRLQTEEIPKGKGRVLIVVDAAHNPPAAKVLARELQQPEYSKGALILVTAMMRDKDAAGFMKAIAPCAKAVLCAGVQYARAWTAGELAARAKKYCGRVETATDVESALDAALRAARPGDTICLTGSFYAIDPGMKWIKNAKAAAKSS